ncbi:hypothetical protein F6Y04_01995 [Bacillus megaterium]|nr:hypothetical protein [Priestia megaterium]
MFHPAVMGEQKRKWNCGGVALPADVDDANEATGENIIAVACSITTTLGWLLFAVVAEHRICTAP